MNDPQCPLCSTPLSEHPANRCLDAWAAIVRGFDNVHLPSSHPGTYLMGRGITVAGPRYSQDIAAAMGLEAEIERAGKIAAYVHALGRIALPGDDVPGCGANYSLWWRLAHATPEQRTKAYIAAKSQEPDHA